MRREHEQRRPAAGRLASALVRLYPREFRVEYGREVARLIRDQRRDLGDASVRRRARFWLAVLGDTARAASVEHAGAWRERGEGDRPRPRQKAGRARGAVGVALLASAGANTVYDLASPKLSMGLAAMLLTIVAAASGAALLLRLRPPQQRG